eukprot:643437-Karenia_brevis.AAC.1
MSNIASIVTIAECEVALGSTWVKSSKKGTLKIQNTSVAMKLNARLNLKKAYTAEVCPNIKDLLMKSFGTP